MADISKSDCHRLMNINFVMNEIYDDISNIYESLVDRDKDQLKKDIAKAIKDLKLVSDNNEDEP